MVEATTEPGRTLGCSNFVVVGECGSRKFWARKISGTALAAGP